MAFRTISATNSNKGLNLMSVIKHKRLLWVFFSRDLKLKYAQTSLGIAWSLIQAITALVIITVFFGMFLKIKIENLPYVLFAYPGMMVWYYFSYVLAYSGTSLINQQHLIKKVYFPKLILPLSKALTGLADLLLWLFVFIIVMAFYKFYPSIKFVFIPFIILMDMIVALSVGIWLSALTIKHRDLLLIIPYVIGFGVFISPILFSSSMIPERFAILMYFNPMTFIIESFRWCLIGTKPPSIYYLISFIPVVLLFISGLWYFKRAEKRIAEEI